MKQNKSRWKVNAKPDPNIQRALARTGYTWKEGILEFIDNSADAIKTRIRKESDFCGTIAVNAPNWNKRNKGTPALIITDNGCGIDTDNENTIGKVWALGSSLKDGSSDDSYGVFGIGMKSAALTLGNSATISSRSNKEHDFLTSLYKSNADSFDIECFKTSELEKELEADYVKELKDSTGTVVVIRNPTDACPGRSADLYASLAYDLARIYRKDLMEKKFVFKLGKNKTVTHEDTFDQLYHDETTIFYLGNKIGEPNTLFIPEGMPEKWKNCVAGIRMSYTPGYTAPRGRIRKGRNESEPKTKVGHGCRGSYKKAVYCYRNGREICMLTGDAFPWKDKSARVSNFFMELHFKDDGADADLPIQTDFGKKSVQLNPEFAMWLKEFGSPIIERIAKLKSSTMEQTEEEEASKAASILGTLLRTERAEAVKGSVDTEEIKDKGQSRPRITGVSSYAGKTRDLKYDPGNGHLKSHVQFKLVDDFKTRDLPFWSEPGEESLGSMIIYINEANSYVKNLKDTKNYDILYQTAGALALSLKVKCDDDEKAIEIVNMFGQLMNDYSESVAGVIDDEEEEEEEMKIASNS